MVIDLPVTETTKPLCREKQRQSNQRGMSDYLPEEVVLEILYRLPVKSLIQFRCVSKSWNSLITSSAFINSHLPYNSSNSNKLIVRHCLDNPYVEQYKLIDDNNDSFDQIQNIELPLTSRRIQHFMLIGSANGLFSLFEQERFVLWNPSIRKFITLPKPCITVKTHGRVTCRPAFGFDPRTNDYKVVRIAFPCRDDMSEEAKPPLIEIYSLNEGCWRITNASFPPGINFTDWRRPTTYLNGAVHFGVYDECKSSCQLVLSFDLGDEVFRLISLPNGAFRESVGHTTVIGGLLSLLFYDDRHVDNNCCAIWAMKDYGVVDSWTKLFAVDVNKEIIRVLGLQKNGSILVEAKLTIGWGLSSYDPKSQQVKNLGTCGRPYYFHVDNYVENLVLLNKPNDAVSERGVSRKRKCRSTSDEERVRQQKTQLEERVCQQKTLLQQQEQILKKQEIILKQQEIILKHQREEMAWQTEKMVTLKSQLAILIQQLRGQSGGMLSGAGDQNATPAQQGSSSASQEM